MVTSLLFYAYGEPVYVFLMIGSVVFNYVIGLLMVKNKKIWLIFGISGNVSLLAVFKYADFAIETINEFIGIQIPEPHIALPIGISFFTFQAMSYLIDVYKGKHNCQKSFWKLLLYISFFPQLIAGPIVKYSDIEKELYEREVKEAEEGMLRFILGLSKKVLIANTVGYVADMMFSCGQVDSLISWMGAITYTLQIYFDFSGYSDMAIGLGQLFGFHFPENFRYPYTAENMTDFWRKWHISLSEWFKEYVYIPLGGNRKGKVRTSINKLIVFLLTGIWHGANWTFALWGIYHGAFLIFESNCKKMIKGVAGRIYTLLAVTVGFVIFRAETIHQAFLFIKNMFCWNISSFGKIAVCRNMSPFTIMILILACLFSGRKWDCPVGVKKGLSLVCLVLCIVFLSGASYNPFIYFRF